MVSALLEIMSQKHRKQVTSNLKTNIKININLINKRTFDEFRIEQHLFEDFGPRPENESVEVYLVAFANKDSVGERSFLLFFLLKNISLKFYQIFFPLKNISLTFSQSSNLRRRKNQSCNTIL
jgi:hypothetical protein